VPLLGLAWCSGEWLQLSSLRKDFALPELELVQFTTKAKGAPVSELRYADGCVEGVRSVEHLGSPPEAVLEILRDLPEGVFRKLRVEHEQPWHQNFRRPSTDCLVSVVAVSVSR